MMPSNRRLTIASMLAFLAPILPVVQPLLPSLLESAVFWTFWLIAPLILMIMRPAIVAWPPMLAFAVLIMVTSGSSIADRASEFAQVALPLLWSILAYRFGAYLAGRAGLDMVWRGLICGVSVFNIMTFIYLGLAASGLIDLAALFELIQRDEFFGLDRFALGNPIYVPLMMTALLHAGLVMRARHDPQILAVTLNLATAALSQSRLIFIIALLVFFIELIRAGSVRIGLVLVFSAVALAIGWELIDPLLESLSSRFGGQDSGSGVDRIRIFDMVFNELTPMTLLIGDGLLGGQRLMLRAIGESRTLESTGLQLFVETGVLGITFYVAALRWHLPGRSSGLSRYTMVSLLLWLEILVLVPVFGTISLVLFGLGVADRERGAYAFAPGQTSICVPAIKKVSHHAA